MNPFLGQILAVGFNFAPMGWALCDGSILSIQTNMALFALLGTAYGGNGSSTFALPDLRGRTLVGQGTGPGIPAVLMGEQFGTTTVTLQTANLPAHTHATTVALPCSNIVGTQTDPTGAIRAEVGTPGVGRGASATLVNGYAAATAGTGVMAPPTVTVATVGANTPVPVTQPSLGVFYIIATQGLYPSRQ